MYIYIYIYILYIIYVSFTRTTYLKSSLRFQVIKQKPVRWNSSSLHYFFFIWYWIACPTRYITIIAAADIGTTGRTSVFASFIR